MTAPTPRQALAGALVALSTIAAPASAARIDARTLRLSLGPGSVLANGASSAPVLSSTGRVTAFATTATNVFPGDGNGALSDVVVMDLATGGRLLASAGPSGLAADGGSDDPVLSANGQRVAFTSTATNLVPGDANSATDVFYRTGTGAVAIASVTAAGRSGNGPSSNPDISADGRFLVFESAASDLVTGDTNGRSDVFVRDLATGVTSRVSVASDGRQASGDSSTPAISGNGKVVSFESSATDLVPGDANGAADIFVRDIARGTTSIASVDSGGEQQDRAVAAPFHMVSDLDRRGRLVVFESDADNLAPADGNRHTDIFLRDRRTSRTRIVSASTANVQGNNDSFSPVITPSGRFVAFQSFASNLAAEDPSGPDVFVRDLQLRATTSVTVAADGSKRLPELVGQLLQRPSISNNGRIAGFASTAPNLTAGDTNGAADSFLRLLAPPVTSIARRSARSVVVTADDPAATSFLCRVDLQRPFSCGPKVSRAQPGRFLVIRALGPGILPDPKGVRVRTSATSTIVDRSRPTVKITRYPRLRSQRTITGRAADRGGSGLARIEIAVTYASKAGCFFLDHGKFRSTTNCRIRTFRTVATGTRSWKLVLPRALPEALFGVSARAVDRAGNRSRVVTKITPIR